MTSEPTASKRARGASSPSGVDHAEVEPRVKDMYSRVAVDPRAEYHFELGRRLAEHLGYDPRVLDQVPSSAIESFAGVGHHFDLAALEPGQRVLDLGSGSGTDSFVAAIAVGPSGHVDGIDMTDAQRPLKALIEDFMSRGGTLYACTPCVKNRGYTEEDLLPGTVISGASVMHEAIKDGAATLSF